MRRRNAMLAALALALAIAALLAGRVRVPRPPAPQTAAAWLPDPSAALAPASRSPEHAAARELSALLGPESAEERAMRARREALFQGEGRLYLLPPDEAYARLHEPAARGDADAMYVLGRRLAHCARLLRERMPEVLLEEYRGMVAAEAKAPEPSVARRQNLARQYREELAAYQSCAKLGDQRASTFVRWLERAGLAGHRRARLAYVEYALDEYEKDDGHLAAHIEEAARRRRLARAWLEAELARGDEEALSLYIEALDGGSALYPRDRFAAELHRYVLTLMRARRMGQFETAWARGPYRHSALTPAQWDEVARRGRALYARAFRDAAE